MKADYGNDLIRLHILQEGFERKAVEEFADLSREQPAPVAGQNGSADRTGAACRGAALAEKPEGQPPRKDHPASFGTVAVLRLRPRRALPFGRSAYDCRHSNQIRQLSNHHAEPTHSENA